MSTHLGQADTSMNGDDIHPEESPKSNGFIFMDMNVYNEDEEFSDDGKINKGTREEEDEGIDYGLPMVSANNLSCGSNMSENNKKQRKKKVRFKSNSPQKENFLEESNTRQKRYRLRSRTDLPKDEVLMLPPETKKTKRTYTRSKGNKTSLNKTGPINRKREKINLKCSHCKIGFTSEDLLLQHSEQCRYKPGSYFKSIKTSFESKIHFENNWIKDGDLFRCQKCNQPFSDKTEIESHINENECKLMFTCDFCQKSVTRLATLRKHIMSHLESQYDGQPFGKTNTCHFCNKVFQRPRRFKVHLLAHQGLSFKCRICRRAFFSQESLNEHVEKRSCSKHNKKCPNCGRFFRDSVKYRNHLLTHKDNKCKSCKKVFIDSDKLLEHVANGCNSGFQKHYECDTCGRKYVKLVKLKIHILNVHQGIKHECEKCLLKFPTREDMVEHTLKGRCRPEAPCTCKICGKVFAKRDYLKKHQYMHLNVLLRCKYCYCTFLKEKNYKQHMEKMNCSKGARKIKMAEFNYKKCRLCEIEYENEETLIEHFRTTHPGEEPHQCFCCESCLPTFKDLQNHIHHHNIQKFTCNLCGKPYTSQEGFRKHRLKHKGAELKCRYCNSEFLVEKRYKLHEETCKKNPELGYKPPQEVERPRTKDGKLKQSRQLNWKSRIIMKRLRGDPQSSTDTPAENGQKRSFASTFFYDDETESLNERGWFDKYYRTEEDDLAFGLKGDNDQQDCDSDLEVSEFIQTNSNAKKKKTNSPTEMDETDPTTTPDPDDDRHEEGADNSPESSSSDSTSDSSEEESIEEDDPPINYNPKKCRLCIVTFGQEYELLHHFIKSHPGEFAHKCPDCGVQSPLFAQLKEHMKTHGIGMGIFNCDNCSKKFKSEKKMKAHNVRCKGMNVEAVTSGDMKSLSSSVEEICKKCGKKFHTKFGYKRHKQICKGKKVKSKNVEKVAPKPKEEPEIEDLQESNDIQVSDQEEDVPSPKVNNEESSTKDKDPVCNGKTEEEKDDDVEKPEDQKKPEKKNSLIPDPPLDSFPCRLCDKKFQYERGIVMHFKSDHPGHKPLVCNVCNVHLADKLKEHLKTHGIGEEFVCELCGKTFNQKFLSKIHEMWHQGVEYKCSHCKQKFLNKEKMDKHISENRCSNRQSLMRLPCDKCGKSYRSKFGLRKHYFTHTPKELRPVKKRLNCEFCGKWFENNNGLQRHRRIHTGEKPFCCRFCPKTFAQEGNCKAHEKIHTGETKGRRRKRSVGLQVPSVPPSDESEPEDNFDSESDPEPTSESESETESEHQPQVEIQTELQSEFQTEPQPQIQFQTEPQHLIQFQTEPQPQIQFQTEPQHQIQFQTEPQPQIQFQTQPPTQIQFQTEPQPQIQFQTEPQPQIQFQTQPPTQIQFQTEPQPQIQFETEPRPQIQFQTEPQPQIQLQLPPPIQIQPPQPPIQIQLQPQTQPQPPVQFQFQPPTQIALDSLTTYPGHYNVYVLTPIDPSGIVH